MAKKHIANPAFWSKKPTKITTKDIKEGKWVNLVVAKKQVKLIKAYIRSLKKAQKFK